MQMTKITFMNDKKKSLLLSSTSNGAFSQCGISTFCVASQNNTMNLESNV